LREIATSYSRSFRYDDVPWNNNNAEHAIKAFARLREVIAGSSTKKGVEEYLTLLSVSE